jgi:hypothetical protein
VKRLQVLIK